MCPGEDFLNNTFPQLSRFGSISFAYLDNYDWIWAVSPAPPILCMTRLSHTCDVTPSNAWREHLRDALPVFVRCDMTQPRVWYGLVQSMV